MDISTDSPPDGRWMTLAELADVRRISKASAARLMRRRRWRRQPGNDGQIRVWVPTEADKPADSRPDAVADIRADVMEVIRPLQDAIGALRLQLDEANARAAKADLRADVLRGRLEAAQQRLHAVEAAETARRAKGRWARLRAAWRGD